jgi:hypothetical protein
VLLSFLSGGNAMQCGRDVIDLMPPAASRLVLVTWLLLLWSSSLTLYTATGLGLWSYGSRHGCEFDIMRMFTYRPVAVRCASRSDVQYQSVTANSRCASTVQVLATATVICIIVN